MTKLAITHFVEVVFHPEVKHPRIADEPAKVTITGTYGLAKAIRVELTLDDVDRLSAVCDTALHPVLDLAEFFEEVEGLSRGHAVKVAEAFDAVDWHLVLDGHALDQARKTWPN